MPRGAWHGFRFHCDGWPRMPIETVLALEDISAKEGVVVRAGEAARYTGAGQTAGAARGLALADLVKGQTGDVPSSSRLCRGRSSSTVKGLVSRGLR